MLHAFRNRLASCLLAVVYLTAGVAGHLLHGHAHSEQVHGDVTGEICRHSHDHDEQGELGVRGYAIPDAHRTFAMVAANGHHDDCTICRAAGQRVLPAPSRQLVELCGLVESLASAATHDVIAVSARTQRSRAPPRAI